MLTTDIENFIARSFSSADRETVLASCRTATIHDGSPAGPRLVRCALITSAPSLEKLRSELEHLKIDYRDVILAAEYVAKGTELVRVHNFNEPIEDKT